MKAHLCAAPARWILAFCLGAVPATAFGQGTMPTEAEIAAALSPKPLTRGLSLAPVPQTGTVATPASTTTELNDAFIERLRGGRARLSAEDRDRISAVSMGQPGLDLDIPFASGSAVLNPKARVLIDKLGAALSRPELREGTYLIGGHTDARGSQALNMALSERRARAVKAYVQSKFKVPARNLISVGFGSSQPKDKAQPFADENRRVQAVNMSAVVSASR